MTAICGGGPSSAKPGYASSLFMGPSAVGALLNNIPTVWAVPLAAYIGYVTYQLSTFCTTDPPAVPTITAQDVLDLLNVYNPIPNAEAGAKFQQLIGAYLWYQVCQCDSVATPAPPTAPAAPADMPALNPPALPQPTSDPCAQWDNTINWVGAASGPYTILGTGSRNTAAGAIPFPGGATNLAFEFRIHEPLPRDFAVSVTMWGFNSSGTSVSIFEKDFPSLADDQTFDGTVSIPSGLLSFKVDVVGGKVGEPGTAGATVKAYCGTQSPATQAQPCCPPDDVTLGLLDRILTLTTLIQRQLSPFSYVASTTHNGLTGEGSIDVQGLIGCKITLTGIPANVGIEDGDPLTYWQAGWIRWGDADGFGERVFISASPQVSFPVAAGQWTRIGYTLGNGVTASIVELVREP